MVSQSGDVVAVFAGYVRAHPRQYAPGTIDKRLSIVRRYVAAVGPRWCEASALEVERWAAGLGVSKTATRDAVSHVRAFYRWAIRTGVCDRDPTLAVDLPRVPRRLPRPARDVAIRVAVAAATPDVRAMLALMAGCGLRCCEVAGLRWVDVDLLAGTLHVHGKHDRERVLEISDDVRRSVAAIDRPGPWVFAGADGQPFTAARVSQIVNHHLRACAAGCTAHQLRHRYATTALAECGRVDVVRDLLGHASVATTEIYARITPGLAGPVGRSVRVPGL